MASPLRIFAIDDDPGILALTRDLLAAEGLGEVVGESDPEVALERVANEAWDLVLLDLVMPKVHGLEVLKRLKEAQPACACVVFTSEDDVPTAVKALQLGAEDYVLKGGDHERLLGAVRKALSRATPPAGDPFEGLQYPDAFRDFVATSPVMGPVFQYVERIALTDLSVIVSGPSGTGKELIARAIHRISPRRSGPFTGINVSSIPRELFASQLFGHAAGAFSGADRAQQGFFRATAGGTLFLDEIGELEPDLQVQLLRVLEQSEFYPVGETRAVAVEARVVVATNRDLRDEVREGRFRSDLYHRLRAAAVSLPPLHERREDIPALVGHFADAFSRELGREPLSVPERTVEILARQPWPGNVRELRNVVREAVLTVRGDTLAPGALPADYRQTKVANVPTQSLAEVERAHVLSVLDSAEGNVSHAARVLGISRATLHRKLKAYGVR